jgi:hypothetical protein
LARRLYSRNGWPVVDVTRKSIEEAAAAIMQIYHQTRDKLHMPFGQNTEKDTEL